MRTLSSRKTNDFLRFQKEGTVYIHETGPLEKLLNWAGQKPHLSLVLDSDLVTQHGLEAPPSRSARACHGSHLLSPRLVCRVPHTTRRQTLSQAGTVRVSVKKVLATVMKILEEANASSELLALNFRKRSSK